MSVESSTKERMPAPRDFQFKIMGWDIEKGTVKIAEGFDDYVVFVPERGDPILRAWPGREKPSPERQRALFSQAVKLMQEKRAAAQKKAQANEAP